MLFIVFLLSDFLKEFDDGIVIIEFFFIICFELNMKFV